MRIDIATLFPEMCESFLGESIIGRARKNGKIEIACHQIREYTLNKQKQVDDYPYGGGQGMLMQADPIFRCYEDVVQQSGSKPHVIYMSPAGSVLTQNKCIQLKQKNHLFIICGHYEGVDQRLIDEIVDEEISIGDFVITGGEMPAMMLTDAVSRLCEGVLSGEECFVDESHYSGLLEYPQYTRPAVWHNKEVPEVLLSGHHANIVRWRRQMALQRTFERRKDMLEKVSLSAEEQTFLSSLQQEKTEE